MTTLVRGFTWKARMFTGAIYEWWTPYKVTRKEAREELMNIANWSEPYLEDGEELVYQKGDMVDLWETKGK